MFFEEGRDETVIWVTVTTKVAGSKKPGSSKKAEDDVVTTSVQYTT